EPCETSRLTARVYESSRKSSKEAIQQMLLELGRHSKKSTTSRKKLCGCTETAREDADRRIVSTMKEVRSALFKRSMVCFGAVRRRCTIMLQWGPRARSRDEAFALHPERFPRGRPIAVTPPREVWINKPSAPPEPGAPVEDPLRPSPALARSHRAQRR